MVASVVNNPLFRAASDLVRFFKAPRDQRLTWQDYLATRRAASFLRAHPWPAHNDRCALVYCRSSWVYGIKLYAMLALALRLDGWRVLFVLSNRRDRWATRYLNAFGFDDFVYWSDFTLNDAENSACDADARAFHAHATSFSEVKDWTYRGCWIGPQILASVSRGTRQGSPDPADPHTRRQVLDLLPATLRMVRLAEKLLDRTQPQLVYLTEPNYAHNGPITDVAVQRGIDFIQVAQIARDDALMLRRLNRTTRREHPSSVALERFEQIAAQPWTDDMQAALNEEFGFRYGGKWFLQARNQPGVADYTREELIDRLHLDPAKKTVCVFSHVLWDANLFYGEDLFEDYGDWFVQTVRAACDNPRVNWLIKLHPANLWKREREGATNEMSEVSLIRKHIGDLPAHVTLLFPDCGIRNTSLFELIDYAVTVRGTVSTELPCLGIPVFTAGTGRAYGMGFTIDSHSREEFLQRMAHIEQQDGLDDAAVTRAKHHALTIFRRRPWPMKTFRTVFLQTDDGRRHPLDHNLELTAHSVAEIQANADLHKFAEWANHPEQVDYLDF